MSHNKNLPIYYNNNAFLDLNNLNSFYTFKLVYNYFNILKDLYINFFLIYFGYTVNNFNLFFFFNSIDIYIDFIIFFYNVSNSLFFKYFNKNNVQLQRLLCFSNIFKYNSFLNKNNDFMFYYIFYFYKFKGFYIKKVNLNNSLMFFNKLFFFKNIKFQRKNFFEILYIFYNYFFYCIFFIIIFFNFKNFKHFNLINILKEFIINFLNKKNNYKKYNYFYKKQNLKTINNGVSLLNNTLISKYEFFFFLIFLLNFLKIRFLVRQNEFYMFFIYFYNYILKYNNYFNFNKVNFFKLFNVFIEICFKDISLICLNNNNKIFKNKFLYFFSFKYLNKFFNKIIYKINNKQIFFFKINYLNNFYQNYFKIFNIFKIKKYVIKIKFKIIILIIFFIFIGFNFKFNFNFLNIFQNNSIVYNNISYLQINFFNFNLFYFIKYQRMYKYIKKYIFKFKIKNRINYKKDDIFKNLNKWRSIKVFKELFFNNRNLIYFFFKTKFINKFEIIFKNIKKKIYLFFFFIFKIEVIFKSIFKKNNLIFKILICFYIRYFKFFRFFLFSFFKINYKFKLFQKKKKISNIAFFYKNYINKFFFYNINIRNLTNMVFFDNTSMFLKYISCFNLINKLKNKCLFQLTYFKSLMFNKNFILHVNFKIVKKIKYIVNIYNNNFFILNSSIKKNIMFINNRLFFNFLFLILKKDNKVLNLNIFQLIMKILNIFIQKIIYNINIKDLDIFYKNFINNIVLYNLNNKFNLSKFFFYNFDFSIFFFKKFLLYFNKLYLKYICFIFCNCLFMLNNYLCLYFNFNFFGFNFFCEFVNYIFKINKNFKFFYFKQNLVDFRFIGFCGLYILLFKFITTITFIFSDILMDYIFLLFSFYFFKNKYGKVRQSLKILRLILSEFLLNYPQIIKGFNFKIKGRLSKRTQRKRNFSINLGIMNWSSTPINYLFYKQRILKTHIGSVSIKFAINFVNTFDYSFENCIYK